MDADLVFIVAYPCPRCHVSLEARVGHVPTWLRCPSCGRASQPPEQDRIDPPPYFEPQRSLIGDGASALPIRPRSMAPMPRALAPKQSYTRLLLGTGFFLTSVICLFSLLESNGPRAGISGVAAVIFLFLLSRRPARPSEDSSLTHP